MRSVTAFLVVFLVSLSEFSSGLDLSVLECKRENEPCHGLPRCCGSLHCHWANGYNPLRAGSCQTCSTQSQICQTNAQCCHPLVCHKVNFYDPDGSCDTTRRNGAECHKDSQCQSTFCQISWLNLARGQGGKCQNMPSA